jgi:hypothetical protein
MITLDTPRERTRDSQDSASFGRSKVTIDLPTDMVLSDANLIEQVFDFTFDVLGAANVELRIREGLGGPRLK